MYLEKSEQLTIWNGGSTKLPAFSLERIAQIDLQGLKVVKKH